MTSVEKRNGKKGVRIAADKFGMTEMLTTRNGFQWNGFEADRELLEMIRDSINEWLGSTPETRTLPCAGNEQGVNYEAIANATTPPCLCQGMTINQPMGIPCPDCGRPL